MGHFYSAKPIMSGNLFLVPSKTSIILLYAHPQAVFYNCVKPHKYPSSCKGGVALMWQMDSQADDKVIPMYRYAIKTLFERGIIIKSKILVKVSQSSKLVLVSKP